MLKRQPIECDAQEPPYPECIRAGWTYLGLPNPMEICKMRLPRPGRTNMHEEERTCTTISTQNAEVFSKRVNEDGDIGLGGTGVVWQVKASPRQSRQETRSARRLATTRRLSKGRH
jgi:hypothetical protein